MPIVEIIIAILLLSILVVVHELGHFLMAKKLGIKVEEFGIGLPPRLWGIKRGETIYSINKLPLGGFVKLAGEDEAEVSSSEIEDRSKQELRRYFFARSKKERAVVLLAGVAMNFLVAVLLISFIFTQGAFVPTDRVHIERVIENSPAAAAGLQPKDVIVEFAHQPIKTSEELIRLTKEHASQSTPVKIDRVGKQIEIMITPRQTTSRNEGPLGIVISNVEERKYSLLEAPYYGLKYALEVSVQVYITLGMILWRLITFQSLGGVDVGGPIRIVEETAKAVNLGILPALNIMALISLNLALINVLPIPALDGGRLLFVVFEKIIGRRVKPKIEQTAHQIFFILLIGLILLITTNDILRKIRGL